MKWELQEIRDMLDSGEERRFPYVIQCAQELAHLMDDEVECLRKLDEIRAKKDRVELYIKNFIASIEKLKCNEVK